MNRRGFLRGMTAILASRVAPYVSTAAGVLMPVRKLWTPSPCYLTDPDAWFIVSAPDERQFVTFDTRHQYDDLAAAINDAGPGNTILVVPRPVRLA